MKNSDRIIKVLNYPNEKEALEIARYKESDFTRNSPLNLNNLTKLLIFREGKTNQMELYNYFTKINKPEVVITKAALTEQRKKLNPELFIYMNQMLANDIYKNYGNLFKIGLFVFKQNKKRKMIIKNNIYIYNIFL